MECLYSGVVGASWVVACSAVNLSTSLIILWLLLIIYLFEQVIAFIDGHGIDAAGHGCLQSGWHHGVFR